MNTTTTRIDITTLALVASLLVGVGRLSAQELTDTDITQAIALGTRAKGVMTAAVCPARGKFSTAFGTTSQDLIISGAGPFNRIMLAANEAGRKYLPFDSTHVTDTMLAPILSWRVDPIAPSYTRPLWQFSPRPDHLVLKTKKGPAGVATVLQPSSVEFFDVGWKNAAGAEWSGRGLTAQMDLAAMQALPPGALEVVVVTEAGEWKCEISAELRRGLR